MWGGRRRWGCVLLALVIFIVVMKIGLMWLLPMVILTVLGVIRITLLSSASAGKQAAGTGVSYSDDWYDRRPASQPEPTRVESIRKLHKSVMQSIAKNSRNPALSAILPDIKNQCTELLASAEKICVSRAELALHVNEAAPSGREVQELAMQMNLENNPKIKAAIEATLERKKAELETRDRISEQIRYMDALLGQAEATFSELKSRIGLTLAETQQYTDPREALSLTESSEQLRTVSEEMRQTLGEL